MSFDMPRDVEPDKEECEAWLKQQEPTKPMAKPKFVFFDFIETVALIDDIPADSLRAYGAKASRIARGKEPFSRIEFGPEWERLQIPIDHQMAISDIRDEAKVIVLTNAPLPVTVHISERDSLDWDAIFCADMFRQCKDHPSVYAGALDLVRCQPGEAMMVAAHKWDTDAAAKAGMQAAFIGAGGDFETLTDLAAWFAE